MNLERYAYQTNESFLDYEFESQGPKGMIKKVVRYSLKYTNQNQAYYNLGFGDWNEEKQEIDDFVISGNEDRDRILATVAATVVSFTDKYPGIPVYAQGSTPARTRLYQMGLNKNKAEIEELFDVYGHVKDVGWQKLNKGINYEAFLVLRKNQVNL